MPDVKFSNQYPYTDFHELNLDWVIDTVKHWSELVGKTIQSITLTGTTGLVDTYTINYSDGTTSTFNVTNGRGITSIALTGSLGLVDTYTITYNDGSTSTFQINNGNGISSIEKTGTSGLIDTYTITFTDGSSTTFEVKNGAEAIDATLTQAGYAADAKAVGDALDLKQDKDEPIALAENLTPYSPDSGVTQAIPFIHQGTGCGNGEAQVDTGSYAQIKKKLGNTICYNQLVDSDTTEVTIPSGRKYWARINGTDVGGTSDGTAIAVTGGTDKFCDLSLWFGSTANIPSHLLSHPEDFGRYYSGSLAYNAGTLVSADGTVLTSIGRNVWNERTRNGYYTNAGAFSANANYVANETPIPVIPNTKYYEAISSTLPAGRDIFFYDGEGNFIRKSSLYSNASFTTPSNCAYINFNFGAAYGTTYKNDFTISLYYPGESGYSEYYLFTVLAQIDTGSEVLRSAGSVADEKTPDGTIIRRVGVADLGGPLAWNYDNGVFYSTSLASLAKPQQFPRCARYVASDGGEDKTIYIGTGGIIYVYDSYYTNVPDFIDGMDSVYMYYELLTPTTEQGTSFPAMINIDDFGSMIWTQTNGVPQGVEIFYPVDYKAFVDSMYNIVSGDVADFATDTELAIVSGRVPTAPAGDGTYVLKATVSGGVPTYSWVAE